MTQTGEITVKKRKKQATSSPVEQRAKCVERFAFFASCVQDEEQEYFFPVHRKLCDFLQKNSERSPAPRHMVVMPRGSLKSTICTVLYPLWRALCDPSIRILMVMNTMPNAKSKLREIRGRIETDPTILGLFPDRIPNFRKTRWSDVQAELERPKCPFPEATWEAAGLRSTLTSRHYDMIIEDDTVAPGLEDLAVETIMPSQEEIDQAIGWHRIATPLMIDHTKGERLVVGTRWAYQDLNRYVMDNEPEYKVFNVPAITNGVAIMPKLSEENLEGVKKSVGSYMFAALYMNSPMKPDDMIFQDSWWQEYKQPPEEVKWYITVDPAISEKDGACDTCIIRTGHDRPNMYVDSVEFGRYTPQRTIAAICDMVENDLEHTKAVGVEDVAYQKALMLFLQDEFRRRGISVPVYPIPARIAKEVRIRSLQPPMENGFFHFKVNGLGMDKLREQLL
jgi:hypothetical protein